MVLTARDPSLRAEDAPTAMLAEPPVALWPGTPAEHGGGFLTPPDCGTAEDLEEIGPDDARIALTTALRCDLADDVERVGPAFAVELAEAILGAVGPTTRWWTNSRIGRLRPDEEHGLLGSWNPLTTATFDTGILGVDREHILVAWVMGED